MKVACPCLFVGQPIGRDVEELNPIDGLHLEPMDLVPSFVGIRYSVFSARDMFP
jgi:hypothetical protein